MSSSPVQYVAAALTDLIYHDNVSTSDSNEERFVVVPVVELPLSYSALNSPEILYLDGTNQILLRCINGLTMIFDAAFENTSPLATYRLNPNARIIYNKHNSTLAVADSKMLCLRQDYGGTFLLKTALKRPSNKIVSVELPLDEATKFLQIVTNDPDSEDILKQRPALHKFTSQLRIAVANLSVNTMESVVIETNGKELLEQLRPLETPGEKNSTEVPSEWMTFIWPYISTLGERVRLMLNPDNPYNFEYSPEWKGLNKDMMASEAARRLTFQNWPHMEYRWALPCRMAEAGFYHQPNNAGDDRVLCFSCFVCLVCWEPSDEPWSEHERHSPKCRFVHNYTNPNVPLVLTMSALSPFFHHLQVNHTSSLVFSVGSSDWIAVASKESAEVHLWRMDSVVQMKQWFSLNSEKFFSAILDCVVMECDPPARRTQRVTWSDDLTNCLIRTNGDEEAQQDNTIKGSSSDECLLKPALSALLADASCETVITALCTVGRPCLGDPSIGTVTSKSYEQNQTLVVVAVSVDDAKLKRVRQQSQSSLETEISTLNTMNRAHEFIDMPPRIVSGSCSVDDCINSGVSLRPFLALYQLDCSDPFSSRKRSSSIRQEDSKPTENKVMHSPNPDEADFAEGVLLMDTTDDAVLEWSDSAYSEQSGFVDLPSGEENEALDGPSKTGAKYDEKEGYVSVNYKAPSMDISFVQCFRLPAAIDNTSMEISAIIPMQNIFMVIVVNNVEPTVDAIHSAILVYLIHFGKIAINVQREPLKAYYYKDFRIMQFSLANMDPIHTNSESYTNNNYLDGGVIRTMEDMVYFINLNTNKLYSLCDEKVAQFAVMDSGKVTLLTRNSGKLITVQIEQSSSRSADYEEDEDAAVAALFSKMNNSQQSDISKNINREIARNLLSSSNDMASVMASEYLSTAGLRRIWKLTRSDIGGPVRGATYRLPYHSGGQPGYHLVAPPGWSEVPANQRIRKYFIENTPVEGVSRTWFYQSDCRRSSDSHIFGLLHFQHGLRVSHVDIFLNFHETCLACPDIELRLYRWKTNADDVSSSLKVHSQASLSGCINLEEVEAQCDLLAGPYHCAEYADLNSHSAKIQLPGIVFLPQLVKKGGNVIGFKSVSYYLVLRALSDYSLDQAITAVKTNERDKLQAAGTPGKTKSSSKRRIDNSESSTATTAIGSRHENTSLISRRGIQWVDELVITVVKTKRAIESNERIERRALIETTDLHNNIVMLAAGIAPKLSPAQKARTEGEKLQQQGLAIGIIEWLIDNWVNTSSDTHLLTFAEMIIENIDAIFVNCFIISSRSISHKWSATLMYLLRALQKSDDAAFSKLLQIFLSCSIRIVTNLHAVRNAGSLHWLFVFIFALLKMAVMKTNDVSCGELLNTLLNAFTNTLTFVGIAWKQYWNGSVHDKLATEYNLSGLPMELVMYEWPRSVLSLWQRTATATTKLNDPNELAHATAFPPAAPTLIAYKWASTAAGYGKGYSEMKPSQNPGMSRYEKISTADSKILNKDCVDANTNIGGLTAEDEIDWLTLFNISTDYAKETSESITEASSANFQREYKYQTVTTSTQLSGLLETEPLTFTVICASDHVKVEDTETGFITEVDCTSAPIGHTEKECSVPLRIMDITQTILNKKSEQNTGNDSGASKLELQDLSADLNARMTLIAMEQAQTKDDNTVGNAEQSSQTVAQGFTTQGSSASTFGIPTTPKTTPFMTPTPLSPSHLSPINSEPNLVFMMENECGDAGEESQENSNQRNEIHSQIPSLVPTISSDIFKLPSQKILLMERISFGSRKFVILDFGMPILLTDLFIPSVAELAAISIDVWLLGENVDGQRLLMTTDICRKSIAVQDLQPFMRIRFVKITYVGRQLYSAACKIPLGLFFGHRYFSSWQIYSYPFIQKEYLANCMPSNQQKKIVVALNNLRQLCEDLRCRHQLVSAELHRLVDESASEEEVKQVYRECIQLSLRWNIVVGVVRRLELDYLSSYDCDQNLEKALCGSWSDCCPDQLQIIAVELFALVTRATHLIDVRTVAMETFTNDSKAAIQTCYPSEAKYARIKCKETLEVNLSLPSTDEIVLQPKFGLDDAVTLFVLFCVPAVPRLQVGCITWLFHHGSESEWWPLFFPRVLKEIFSAQLKKHDRKIFLQLSFLCNHSVKSSSKQSAIILELFNLIKEIAVGALDNDTTDYHCQNNLDVTLLCWSLMLLSSAFDVIAYNKKNNRWAFIGGEYSRVMTSNEKDDSMSRWHKKKLKFGNSDEKTTESLKNISSATLKTQLETLWEKHLKVMEAMKANMKISKTLNAKMQKKVELEKKIRGLSPPSKMGHSVFAETDFPTELTEELHATLLPFLGEQQMEEILAKKYVHQQNSDLKTSADSSESALKKAISMASKSNSRPRYRQYNIRLKLPREPCVDVARKLITLLCDFEKQLPILAKLIICKVVARICISASHHTIPLICVLEDPIDKLIRIGLEEQGTGLLKYAVLHLILDVIEAESRAVPKLNVSSKNQIFTKTKDSKTSEISEELDLLCMRHTGCHFADIILRAKSENEAVEDVKERKSTGITAAVCCLPEAFCGAKTSRSFSIANYDEQPDLGSELLETLIYQILVNTRQAVVPDGPSGKIRSHTYQRKAREMIKERLAKGERFCYVFRWIDDLLEAEEQAARSCDGDLESYLEIMETQISSNTTYEGYTTTSKSAFIACCISEYMRYLNVKRSDESIDGLVSSSPVAEQGSSSPSAPESPTLPTADVEMKESEHKTAQNDEDMDVMKNTVDFADNVSAKAAADSIFEVEHLETQDLFNFVVRRGEASMETEPCCSAFSAFSESKVKRGMEKWVPVKWIPKISVNRKIYVEHIMACFLGELRLARNDILVQPCSFVYPDHLTQHLGLNQHVHCMNMDFLADVITRYSVRDLSRWRACLLSRPRLPEDETMRAKLGETMNATNSALGRFIQSISPTDSNESVQQLLTFCLDFEAGLIHSTKKLPAVGKCILPAENITSIVNFAVVSNSLSQHLWVLVLRILDLIVKNDSMASALLIGSPLFCKLINNFLVESIARVNQSLTTGPSTLCAFKNFITRLHESHDISLRGILCVKILTVLKDIFSQQVDLINFSYPIDCLVELLNVMTNYASDYVNVAPQELAGYISSSIHTARNFIHYYKTSGTYSLVSADSYLRPNICFQVTQKIPINVQHACENADFPHFPYMPELWGQYGPHYAQLPDFVDPKRPPTSRSDSLSRFSLPPRWQNQSNMFRQVMLNQVVCYLDHSSEVSDYLLGSFPSAIEELFEIVATCESAVPDVNLISLQDWNHITLGDHALSMLLKVSQRVSRETKRLFEIAVQVIKRCANSSIYSLSKPLAFAFVQMLGLKHNQIYFAELGGHLIVARELERSILASANDWTAPISAPLMRQLASLSAQVAGSSDYGWQTSKLQTDVQDDGLYNYAPLCTISSEQTPNISGQLLSLIAVAAPRRTRSANWSYHFNEGSGEWFDITLNLPYHIVLHEVQIRPHVPALSTSPSAVQVELCSETSLTQWCSLGAPLSTTGYSKIRISTDSYKLPVIAVRLYFKKPPDSTNLSLSQILLLGMNFTTSLSYTYPKNTDFVQWLSIMVQLCHLEKYCIWQYAPELPRAVVALFLGRPLSSLVYHRISELFCQIDHERAKPYSIVELIFQYIEQGNTVTSESLEWLPNLLFTLCARNSSPISDGTVRVQNKHRICVVKQYQVLLGVTSVITSQNYKKPLRDVAAVLIWTASCILWHNINVEERRFDTLALCMDLTPQLLPFLCEMAVDVSEQCNDTFAKSASWLLCSLMRGAPHFLRNALKEIGLLDMNDKPKREGVTQNAFTVVQRMCQSRTSISQLHSFGLLQYWIELVISYCEETSMEHMSMLVSIVRCLASLCCIEDVVKFLDFIGGSRFFNSLIKCVVRCAASPGDMTRTSGKQSIKLEDATVSLLSQCVTVGGSHRQRIAHVLCSLLKSTGSFNGAIQQMVLKCIFDDEMIPVKAIDEDTSICFLSFDIPNRILHPFFGCTRRERFLKVSLYTSMDEVCALCEHKNTSDFRQLAKIAAPLDELHHFSSVVNSQDLTTAFPPFNSSRLMVRSCNGLAEMMGDWKIGQLLGDLFISGRLTSSAWKQKIAGGDTAKKAVEDSADGYYTVALSFIQRSGLTGDANTVLCHKSDVTLTEQTSTLQYFARASGLALLALHLQVHHPSFNSPTVISSFRDSKVKSAEQRWLIDSSETVAMNEMLPSSYACPTSIFSSPDLSAGEPVYSTLYVPVFGSETDLGPSYEDFEYIDSAAPGEVKGWTYYPLFSQTDNSGTHATPKKLQKIGSQPSNQALSPHVVVSFSLFLRLEGYAELLVTYDRKRAKGLLRLAMGVITSEASLVSKPQVLKPGVFHRATQSQSQSKQKSECENLGSLPFIVLGELFNKYLPSTAAGKSLREAAVTNGVLDVLLDCLAHYTHQKHKEKSIRPSSFPPAPETAVLVERLLRGSMEQEQSLSEGTNLGLRAEERMNSSGNAGPTASSASNATQQHSFWAKGTGFGSGTTQQQWNVDLHVLKRKQDEQNVTHLLRVLSSFIYPKINEYLEAEKSRANNISGSNTVAPLASLDSEDIEAHSRSQSISPMSMSDSLMPGPSSGYESLNSAISSTVKWSLSSVVIKMLSRSCLLPAIWAYLRNDSVLDISQHVELYESVMHIVAALALSPKSTGGNKEDEITALLSEPESGCSMNAMLKKLFDCVSAYLTRLAVESNETRLQNLNIQQTAESNEESTQTREEGLMRLAPLITTVYVVLSKRVKELPVKSLNIEKDAVTEEERYMKIMKALQFDTISFFAEGSFIPYHYENSLSSVGTSSSMGKRTRRLAQEIVTLSNSLPLSLSSSVFVRACEERLDVMKVLITGPADTPYMNGCFEFDVWFPTDYPNSPMHINLETTGNHTVRFNPNLYNDGKVCLSVLNTWHGRPEERWNPETSSLLQVIVSVQSLILVAEPYFNEPGYERSKCTQAGQQASRDYDANIRQAVVKWAMLEVIRHPPPAFADIVKKHFWLKRKEILSQISKWISEMEQTVKQQRGSGRSIHSHLASLKRHAAALEDEYRRMECPADLQNINVSLAHQASISENIQADLTMGEQQPQGSDDSAQIPHDSLKSLSVMKILKL